MATYILATKLTPELTKNLKRRAEIGRQWMKRVKRDCPRVKFLAHYALLGRYDFLDIYEAPDEKTAMKVSMISLASGAVSAESWPAIPYKEFLEIIKDL
ncbi:MAG: GYD domain-containing protein [Candidatus Edwardsbacteria bacterium]|nr:GYD domain-containing protein [Candidatus Edwardsbacteria bacterium]